MADWPAVLQGSKAKDSYSYFFLAKYTLNPAIRC